MLKLFKIIVRIISHSESCITFLSILNDKKNVQTFIEKRELKVKNFKILLTN